MNIPDKAEDFIGKTVATQRGYILIEDIISAIDWGRDGKHDWYIEGHGTYTTLGYQSPKGTYFYIKQSQDGLSILC